MIGKKWTFGIDEDQYDIVIEANGKKSSQGSILEATTVALGKWVRERIENPEEMTVKEILAAYSEEYPGLKIKIIRKNNVVYRIIDESGAIIDYGKFGQGLSAEEAAKALEECKIVVPQTFRLTFYDSGAENPYKPLNFPGLKPMTELTEKACVKWLKIFKNDLPGLFADHQELTGEDLEGKTENEKAFLRASYAPGPLLGELSAQIHTDDTQMGDFNRQVAVFAYDRQKNVWRKSDSIMD